MYYVYSINNIICSRNNLFSMNIIEIQPYNKKVKVIVWILILQFAYFSCSCGTKKTHTETKRDYEANYIYNDSSFLNIDKKSFEDLLKREKLKAIINIKKYSDPDSLGQQHVEEEINIDLTNESETNVSKSDSTAVRSGEENITDIKIKENEEITEDTKKDNRPFPMWVWWALGISILLLVIYKAKGLFF